MAAGQAQAWHRRMAEPGKVRIVDHAGETRWDDLWAGLPFIAAPGEPHAAEIVNGPGVRPYIERWASWNGHPQTIYSSWRAAENRPCVALAAEHVERGRRLRERYGRFAVLGVRIGETASPNKEWPQSKFSELARLLAPDVTPVVLSPYASSGVTGTVTVTTATFREALGVLAAAALYVGVEGMHHGAAALGVPAVVLMGHFANVDAVGYPDHANLAAAGGGCGRWGRCPECAGWMASLDPVTVAEAARGQLQEVA